MQSVAVDQSLTATQRSQREALARGLAKKTAQQILLRKAVAKKNAALAKRDLAQLANETGTALAQKEAIVVKKEEDVTNTEKKIAKTEDCIIKKRAAIAETDATIAAKEANKATIKPRNAESHKRGRERVKAQIQGLELETELHEHNYIILEENRDFLIDENTRLKEGSYVRPSSVPDDETLSTIEKGRAAQSPSEVQWI
jgi:hypothetical protein